MNLRAVLLVWAVLVSHAVAQVPKGNEGEFNRSSINSHSEQSPARVFRESAPQTVTVTALDSDGNPISIASGFFATAPLVVTNLHAIKWASAVVVKPYGTDQRLQVKSVPAFDIVHDLCVLEVDPSGHVGLPLGSPAGLKVGDPVYVIGNPKGLEGTFSKGMVTALRKSERLIQIDAPISPGSSGGPVMDGEGKWIGVATSSIVGGQNLNFATPSDLFQQMDMHSSYPVKMIGALALSDLEYGHFKGPLRSYLEASAEVRAGKLVGPTISRRKETFDESGRGIGISYFKEGRPTSTSSLYYDSNGLKEKSTSVSEDGKQIEFSFEPRERAQFTSSPRGYSESFDTWDDKNRELDHRKRDSRGNETEFECPARSEKWLTSFDSAGRESETRVFRNSKLAVTYRFDYETDSYGNWTMKNEYIWMAELPDSGFLLSTIYTRQLEYFGNP